MVSRIFDVGTVSVAAGSTTVTGGGNPLWLTNGIKAWCPLQITGYFPVQIKEVVDEDTIELVAPWPGADVAGAGYVITDTSIESFAAPAVAQSVVRLAEDLAVEGTYVFVRSGLDAPPVWRGDEGQTARQPSTSKEWYKEGGAWRYVGEYSNIAFSTVEWNAETTYGPRTVQPHAGKLWISKRGNVGIEPGTSLDDWVVFYPFPTQSSFTVILDSGGSEIAAGSEIDVPPLGVNAIITGVSMRADGVGSVVLDIRKRAFAAGVPRPEDSICASTKPTLATARDYADAILTGWTKNISTSEALQLVVESCAGITRLAITFRTDRIFN
ncbi:hypothetical protein Rpal_3336 [Rhodopseudomonas palustris TIE-1]|uniref:hypothetical protein n=1 Tax=Rhodopseudomonas palustris TaxID=1076 RepID=UPI000164A6CA|nr:hypothetical protein [Rhodopseudomonas palustris]ACF01838.1 hypothetical protein Rpal_3336 [Rhodopseudomonas palustris TIE-1]